MNKKEFSEQLKNLINSEVTSNNRILNFEEKIRELEKQILKYKIESEFNQDNKGKAWTDDELKIILSFPPTKENCLKLAKAFRRGYGSIEQIYRWASTPKKDLEGTGRENDAFIQQIQRVYTDVGWKV